MQTCREENATDREGHVMPDTEKTEMQLEARKCQGSLATTRNKKKAKKIFRASVAQPLNF